MDFSGSSYRRFALLLYVLTKNMSGCILIGKKNLQQKSIASYNTLV